jgi:hypothetical protein
METRTESVYECTLAVEAHMICDLLTQAGIAARVDGGFLTGAGGELPLGNTVRVRVEPARAAEAREVIADWEKTQTGDEIPPTTASPRVRSPLWFLVGAIVGAGLAVIVLRLHTRVGTWGVDYDGDGRDEVVYHYSGSMPSLTTVDRNRDGAVDARWTFDSRGLEKQYEADDDFDGRFEWRTDYSRGEFWRSVLDSDGDGRPEQVWHFENGVLESIDYHFASGGRIVKRERFEAGLKVSAEYDDDRDNVFERRVEFDRHGEPKL